MSSESLTLQSLNIAPVKSLGLCHPQTVHVAEEGIIEDRRFHVIDAAGRLMTQRQISKMVQIKAEYQLDSERLSLTFPDGSVVEGLPEAEDTVKTFIFGRMVGGRVVGGGFGEALSHFCDADLRLVKSDKPGSARTPTRFPYCLRHRWTFWEGRKGCRSPWTTGDSARTSSSRTRRPTRRIYGSGKRCLSGRRCG